MSIASLGGVANAQQPLVRDSADVRIVENPSRATAPVVFKLGALLMDLGGPAANPNEEFNRGIGLGGIRLGDGTVVVPDVERFQFFDTRGARTGALGRRGQGPLEFASLVPAETCRTRGDTIVAGDYRNGRFAIVHRRRIVSTTPYRGTGAGIAGCFDDGTVLVRSGLPGRDRTFGIQLNRLRLDGSVASTFREMTFRTPTAVAHLAQPSIRVWGDRVFVGDGATSEIRVHRADGRLTRVIRSMDQPLRITPADVERELRTAPAALRDQWHPDTYPAYRRFLVGSDGTLWVQDFVKTLTDRDGWTAFDSDGLLLGRIEIPRVVGGKNSNVSAFGAGEVQLVRSDNDGFSHLLFFRIERIPR